MTAQDTIFNGNTIKGPVPGQASKTDMFLLLTKNPYYRPCNYSLTEIKTSLER